MTDWTAALQVEKGAPPSGDIVFVSTDAIGSPGGMKEEILRQLKLSPDIVPNSEALSDGYRFVPQQGYTICFVVTVGRGLVESALTEHLAAALRSTEAYSAKRIWLPLMGTGAGNLTLDQSLNATIDAIELSQAAFRTGLNITISAPPSITEDELQSLLGFLKSLRPWPDGAAPNSPNQTEASLEILEVAGFTADRVGKDDLLNTIADAKALARLICLKDAAPLAVAIFGGWGSGKSTFMSLIESEIDKIMPAESEAAKSPTPKEGLATFVHPVVHIRFNAWQFADANLWVSLTAEFFDQLRAGGHNHTGSARYAELVGRVDRHAQALAVAADASHLAAAQASDQLAKAQTDRDEAAKEVDKAEEKAVALERNNILQNLYKEQKPQLLALGFTQQDVQRIVDVVSDSSSIVKYIKAFFQSAKTLNRRVQCAISITILVAIAAILWTMYGQHFSRWVRPVFAALPIAGTWAVAMVPAFRLVKFISQQSAQMATAISNAKAEAARRLSRKEAELIKAKAQAQASQEIAGDNSLSLTYYTNSPGASAGKRLLHYVLEDDPDTKQLQKELGLIDRTRRLFQTVNSIVQQDLKKREEEELERIRKEEANKAKAKAADGDPITVEATSVSLE
jgi:hypothetical protein